MSNYRCLAHDKNAPRQPAVSVAVATADGEVLFIMNRKNKTQLSSLIVAILLESTLMIVCQLWERLRVHGVGDGPDHGEIIVILIFAITHVFYLLLDAILRHPSTVLNALLSSTIIIYVLGIIQWFLLIEVTRYLIAVIKKRRGGPGTTSLSAPHPPTNAPPR